MSEEETEQNECWENYIWAGWSSQSSGRVFVSDLWDIKQTQMNVNCRSDYLILEELNENVRVHTEISNFGGEPPLLRHSWEIWGRFPLKRHFRWSRLERKSPFALHSVSSQSKRNNCYIKYMAFYMAFYIFHWYIKIIFYLLFIII